MSRCLNTFSTTVLSMMRSSLEYGFFVGVTSYCSVGGGSSGAMSSECRDSKPTPYGWRWMSSEACDAHSVALVTTCDTRNGNENKQEYRIKLIMIFESILRHPIMLSPPDFAMDESRMWHSRRRIFIRHSSIQRASTVIVDAEA